MPLRKVVALFSGRGDNLEGIRRAFVTIQEQYSIGNLECKCIPDIVTALPLCCCNVVIQCCPQIHEYSCRFRPRQRDDFIPAYINSSTSVHLLHS